MHSIKILTFNVLAPCFANPVSYPCETAMYLNQKNRRKLIINFLREIKHTYDIIGLQEVTDDTLITGNEVNILKNGEFKYYKSELEDEFAGMFYPHKSYYWNEWMEENHNSQYSYCKNGNALFLRNKVFDNIIWSDISLFTGNIAVKAEAYHIKTDKKFRVSAIHLDSESSDKRLSEFSSLMEYFPYDNNITDIILGDFNTDTNSGELKDIINKEEFIDIVLKSQNTSNIFINFPTFSIIPNNKPNFPIDHIIYRSSHAVPQPIIFNELQGYNLHTITGVLDNGLWKKYKVQDFTNTQTELNCLDNCLMLLGSDHIPVVGTLLL